MYAKTYLDPQQMDYQLEQAVLQRDFAKFSVLLELDSFTQNGLNRCLAFSAAAQGLGNFSETLIEAGADIRIYLNGRMDRAAAKGSVEKVERWRNVGADIHHDDDQPLRSALFTMQENTVTHLVGLGCSFDRALSKGRLHNAISLLNNGRDILKFTMQMKTDYLANKF